MRYFLMVLSVVILSCKKDKPLVATSVDEVVFIPLPREVTAGDYGFLINQETAIERDTIAVAVEMASQFKELMSVVSSSLMVRDKSIGGTNTISFDLVASDSISHTEGYVLDVNQDRIALAASDPAGLYRGFQTLKQLLPNSLIAGKKIDSLVVPGVKIVDRPEFQYRGMMLDVARHFFTVTEVKRLIDQMVSYKLNYLHLHLTDDQGWRIEITSWPRLTQIGGSSSVRNERAGYYTQKDYKEIVAYAASRYITIIPEIDMPGHTNAALASYPELNCDGKATKLYTGMRVGFSTLCVDKEITYTFIDDVIRELVAMTTGPYIHLGGDESHVTSKKDYNRFMKKAFAIVKKYDKQVIGWEEIQSADIDSTYVIQHWQKEATAQKGIDQGAKVILSPAKRMYLDMKYTKDSPIGLTWAGTTEVDSAYVWKPWGVFGSINTSQILGLESPLWSETIASSSDIEYLTFPRLLGHAELGWSDPELVNWKSYSARLQKHYKRMDIKGIKYYKSPKITMPSVIKQ